MSLIIDDNFNRSNTSAGGAGTTTGVGNGWTDVLGGVWSIQSDQLQGVVTGSAAYQHDLLLQPTSSDVQDINVIMDGLYNAASYASLIAVVRRQTNNDHYQIQLGASPAPTTGALSVFSVVGGSPSSLGSTVGFTATVGHAYELSTNVYGVNPTTITATVTDTTTNTVVANYNNTDSSSTLQTSGQFGLSINAASGGTDIVATRFRANTYTAPTQVIIAVNDSNAFFTRNNWYISGSTYAQTNNGGAYCRVGFSGTSIAVNLDLSPLTGGSISTSNYPLVVWSIDNGSWSSITQISSSSLTCATGLSSGNHTMELFVINTSRTDDRWNGPANVIRITGFTIDSGASSQAITVASNEVIYYGDSIGEGDLVLGTGTSTSLLGGDARYSPSSLRRYYENAEVSNVSFASQGWYQPAGNVSGNVPNLATTWNLFDANHSRLTTGLYTKQPTKIIICTGVNDANQSISDANVTTTVTSLLTSMRTAAPTAWIEIDIPASGAKASAIQSGFNAYQSSTPDIRCKLINDGSVDSAGMGISGGGATQQTADGVHPLAFTTAKVEAHRVGAWSSAIVSSGTGSNAITITVTSNGSTPISGAKCWVTNDSGGTTPITGVFQSDSGGHVSFNLTSGTTYYFWGEATGYLAAGVAFTA